MSDSMQNETSSIDERFFYHSFPRRGTLTDTEVKKGCQILTAIRDFGLLLTPELIEWRQPTLDGSARTFPIVQNRACLTELPPRDLRGHSQKFGGFALEFEIDVVRGLGAIPVFYLPQPSKASTDGSGVGASILSIAMDAHAIISRMAILNKVLQGDTPVADKFNIQLGFARSPNDRGEFTLDRDETRNVLLAIGHGATPWGDLNAGMSALLNFFYPADNTKTDKTLAYYRQREWRIACGFQLNHSDGSRTDVLHSPTAQERERLLEIDREFFTRKITTDTGSVDTLDVALMHPGLQGKRLIEMVRRVIVPRGAVEEAVHILSALDKPPPVLPSDDLT